jgi:flagellar basal-body rod protein FlgG
VFTQGSLYEADGATNLAVSGNGFFGVRGADGNTYYTRNGNFAFDLTDSGIALTTSDGLMVLDTEGQPITLDGDLITSKITIGNDGTLYYPDDDGIAQSLGHTIGLWQFNNPAGLDKQGDTLFAVSEVSGEALNEATNTNLKKSKVIQGYLEGSNVQIADEMVNLIVAQRAYEMNSKVITTSDEMLEEANQLKR